jgi:hypothetical protein
MRYSQVSIKISTLLNTVLVILILLYIISEITNYAGRTS